MVTTFETASCLLRSKWKRYWSLHIL